MDYIVADHFVIPADQAACYSENIIWMPNSYQINDRKRRISEKVSTRAELGLPDQGLVFCCFNAHYKITAEVFAIWMRLLKQIPESVLWLLDDNAVSKRNLCNAAMEQGIEAARLVFATRMAHADHLARHRHADIFLDTTPTNAHTTASDALWAGLPVITCRGTTFMSRVSASLLHAVGLSELVTADFAEYEKLALELALNSARLSAIKSKLLEGREQFPLFDSARFCRHLESAFFSIWQRSQQELPPTSFYVTD
jgi:predicted O-linked N-acetylglucosamine transferase (SPINDLY family)